MKKFNKNIIFTVVLVSITTLTQADTLEDLMSQYGEVCEVSENEEYPLENREIFNLEENASMQENSQENSEELVTEDNKNVEYSELYSDKDKESVQFTYTSDSQYPLFIDTGIKTTEVTLDEMNGLISQIINYKKENYCIESEASKLLLVDGRIIKIEQQEKYSLEELNELFNPTQIRFEYMQSKQNNQFVLSDYLQVNKDFRLIILGKEITLERRPFIENNRVLFPLREITEGLNATVDWDRSTGIITIEKNNKKLVFEENSLILTVLQENQIKKINVQAIPRIINANGEHRIYGYVDDILMELGYEIYWDANKLAVIIE